MTVHDSMQGRIESHPIYIELSVIQNNLTMINFQIGTFPNTKHVIIIIYTRA